MPCAGKGSTREKPTFLVQVSVILLFARGATGAVNAGAVTACMRRSFAFKLMMKWKVNGVHLPVTKCVTFLCRTFASRHSRSRRSHIFRVKVEVTLVQHEKNF